MARSRLRRSRPTERPPVELKIRVRVAAYPFDSFRQKYCELRENRHLLALIVRPKAVVLLRFARYDEYTDEIMEPPIWQPFNVQIHLR